jgi:hypothetical protein
VTPLARPGFLLVLLLAAAGCPSSDDDDDTIGGEGEGEGEVCDARTCDGVGQQCCDTTTGSACVNTTSNFNHCGECGSQCDQLAANLCADGGCACGESEACDGTEESTCCPFGGRPAECVDTLSNAEACGGCNNNCIAPGTPEKQSDRCLDGGCVCGDAGEACDGNLSSTCCPDEGGGSSCHNIQTDPENCGGCSLADRDEDDPHVRDDGILDEHHRCDAEVANICRLAACVCGIPEDIGVEPAACGGGPASTCCAPANPADADLAVCANLETDELHCGECNNPCAEGENCTGGECG